GRRGLPELNVAEADLTEGVQPLGDARNRFERRRGLFDGLIERVRDRQAAVTDLERFAVVPPAAARLALDVDIRQKVHLDAQDAVALASLAAPARHVERESTRLVATRAGLRQARVEIAQVGEDPGIGRRVRSRGPADRRLIDADDLVDMGEAFYAL